MNVTIIAPYSNLYGQIGIIKNPESDIQCSSSSHKIFLIKVFIGGIKRTFSSKELSGPEFKNYINTRIIKTLYSI